MNKILAKDYFAGESLRLAMRAGGLHEIKPGGILSPGPGAIAGGLARMERFFANWARARRP